MLTAVGLAQSVERLTAEQKVTDSMAGPNTKGLKITDK